MGYAGSRSKILTTADWWMGSGDLNFQIEYRYRMKSSCELNGNRGTLY